MNSESSIYGGGKRVGGYRLFNFGHEMNLFLSVFLSGNKLL